MTCAAHWKSLQSTVLEKVRSDVNTTILHLQAETVIGTLQTPENAGPKEAAQAEIYLLSVQPGRVFCWLRCEPFAFLRTHQCNSVPLRWSPTKILLVYHLRLLASGNMVCPQTEGVLWDLGVKWLCFPPVAKFDLSFLQGECVQNEKNKTK